MNHFFAPFPLKEQIIFAGYDDIGKTKDSIKVGEGSVQECNYLEQIFHQAFPAIQKRMLQKGLFYYEVLY